MNDIKGYFRLTLYWKQLPVFSSVSGSSHIGKDFDFNDDAPYASYTFSGTIQMKWRSKRPIKYTLHFGIGCLLEIAARVRSMRFKPLAGTVVFKGDGSPTVAGEYAIEQYLRDRLQPIASTASVMGEESGGSLCHQVHNDKSKTLPKH